MGTQWEGRKFLVVCSNLILFLYILLLLILFLYILLLLIWHMYFFGVCIYYTLLVVIIICIMFVKLRKSLLENFKL